MFGRSLRWSLLRLLALLAIIDFQGIDIASAQTPAAEDDENPGLVGEGEYVSPQFDIGITWPDDWEVADPDDEIVDHAIGGNFDGPVASDAAAGDIVFLTDTATKSSVLSLGFTNVGAASVEDVTTLMQSPEFLTENLFLNDGATLELVDSTGTSSAALGRDAAPDTDHFSFLTMTIEPDADGLMFWVGLDVYDPAAYEDILTSMGDIEVDGYEMFPVVSQDDLLAAMLQPAGQGEDDGTPAPDEQDGTPAPDEQDGTPAPGEDNPGLVSDTEFESPQFGIGITWGDEWVTYESERGIAVSDEENQYDALYLTDAETGNSSLYFTIEANPKGREADELLSSFEDPDYITDVLGLSGDTDVLLSETDGDNAAVVLLDADTFDAPVLVVLEAHLLEGGDVISYTDFRIYADEASRDLLANVAAVEVDGESALSVFTSRQIVSALPEE